MHHLYPAVKGDPLCPLGFHPQVRWPTRCKRCFRDYKEHGNRKELDSSLRKDDSSASTPSLSAWGTSSSRSRDDSRSSADSGFGTSSRNSWSSGSTSSSTSTSSSSSNAADVSSRFGQRPASWTSTPDLGKLNENTQAEVTTVSFTLPRRRPQPPDTGQASSAASTASTASTPTAASNSTAATGERRRRPAPIEAAPPAVGSPPRRRRPTPITDEPSPEPSFTVRRGDATPAKAASSSRAGSLLPYTGSGSNSSVGGGASNSSPADKVKREAEKAQRAEQAEATARQRRVRIASLKEVHAVDEPTNPEVEFIIQKQRQEKSSQSKVEKTGYNQGADWSDVERVKSSTKKSSKNDVTNNYKSPSSKPTSSSSSGTSSDEEESDDATSTAGTETTETTLVDRNENELLEQIESLKQELEVAKSRNERLEREKSDILLRRIASMDMSSSRASSSEVTRLQQKVNELTTQMEDMRDDKKSLSLRVKELEQELDGRPDKTSTNRAMDDLRSKLLAAETLCEELMDENEDMKRELRDLEEEIEEMQDNFREDQADEYSSLKKELEQTTKNCRILSFKLRKAERKTEALEAEKLELDAKCRQMAGGQSGLEKIEKITKLEHDLNLANEVASRLQKELDETKEKLKAKEEAASKDDKTLSKKKAPKLADMSGHLRVSRESLTRGGSQEDPAVLLRDLQDAMEREADLREQLRFAEEEAQTLRKKTARMEDDNESLVLQLKKMATKARSRIKSPSPARMTPEPTIEKDEGISEEDDPAELRLQLELNEQEAAVLRRKVEELEKEGDKLKKKVKDLEDKLNAKPTKKLSSASIITPEPGKNALYDQKIKVLEEELSECRMKLIEKERDIERLHAELTVTQKRSKGSIQKSKSLDSGNEQQALDLKRQLQTIEQEANILKSRNQTLESENEKLSAENKRLVLLRGAKKPDPSAELKEKVSALENELTEAKNKVNELQSKTSSADKADDSEAEEVKKLKAELTKIGGENEKLSEALKRLKDEATSAAAKFYKQRTPKKPTELMSKVQLKKMVEDLESEIGEVLVVLRKSEVEKTKLKKGAGAEDSSQKEMKEKLDEALKKVQALEKELKDEKEKAEKDKKLLMKDKKTADDDKKKLEELKKKYEDEKKTWEAENKKAEDSKKKIEDENKKVNTEKEKLSEEKKKLEEEVSKLSKEKDAAVSKQEELSVFIQRVEALKKELEDEQKQGVELRKKLEAAQKAEQEKAKAVKELADKTLKLSEAEKKFKEVDEKLKKTERLLTSNKKKVVNLEKELNEEKERAKATESTQQGVAASWLAERDDLKQQIATLQSQVDSQEIALSGKTALIEQLEANVKEERERAASANKKTDAGDREEVNALRDELTTTKSHLQELTQALEKAESNKKAAEETLKKRENELIKDRDDFERKAADMEIDLQAERKKIERMKNTQEKELRNRETELAAVRTKLRSLESNSNVSGKKTAELQQEFETRIRKLEEELSTERQEYEDLTAKYEILEEEHVVTKAQLVMEKEALQSQLHSTKRDMSSVETELRTLRETYNSKQDAWIKEKLDQQEKLKELEEKMSRSVNNETLNMERSRSKSALEQKNLEIENLKRESEVLSDQMNHLRRENEDMRRKLDDFDKVVKVHRNMTADTSALEKEVRDLRNTIFQDEKTHKSEMAQLKMRYDSQVAVIGEELQSLQGQVSRFKRERDTFRHMLEGAQKTIAELKAHAPNKDSRPPSSASGEEAEETQTKIATLEQQINCMEDELSEARLESSKLKTELVSERSSWEIKLSELQSRVNELEEERILTSGRTKIPGMRTRMELAWSKEREELQRLLQETSTLARDLRQTLFEVERERDKERLESKRRIDQLKKSSEEEVDENKKKVTELQCDLLELRDAHAKLRTTNEKLRREKERHEREREELKQLATGKRRAGMDEDRRVNILLDQVDELMRLAPELFQSSQSLQVSSDSGVTTPTPPRRTKGPKSRESSPGLERRDTSREPSADRKIQLQSTVQRLTEATEALRRYQRSGEEERERERARRTLGIRRAASTESDNPPDGALRPKGMSRVTPMKQGSLHRKALSLEQTSAQEQVPIWKLDDEGDGSFTSLQSVGSTDLRFYSLNRRENSTDSRLSGGSTQSEFVTGEKKKKKGLLGKLKQLTKSRSIDDTSTARDYMSSQGSLGGSGSDISVGGEEKGSKKDLRDRLTGMFKISGSRANSVERSKKEPSPALPERSDSVQRPLLRNGSSSTLPRPSPARSDVSTSSVSRPLVPGKTTPVAPTSTLRRAK